MNLSSMFSFSVDSSFQPENLRLRSTSMSLRPWRISVVTQSLGVSKSLLDAAAA